MDNFYPWQTDPKGFLASILHVPASQINLYSAARSPAHNAAVGGVPNSEHIGGNALDFGVTGWPMGRTAQATLQGGQDFDQLINEGNHVHIGFRPGAERHQVIGMGNTSGSSSDPLDAAADHAFGSVAPAAPSHQSTPSGDALDQAFGSAEFDHAPAPAPPPPAPQAAPQTPQTPIQHAWNSLTGHLPENVSLPGGIDVPVRDPVRAIPGGLLNTAEAMGSLPRLAYDVGTTLPSAMDYFPGGNPVKNLVGKYVTPAAHVALPSYEDFQKDPALNTIFGGDYKPQTPTGEYARTIASFAGGMGAKGGTMLGRLLRNTVLPGATSQSTGDFFKGTSAEPYAKAAGAAVGSIPAFAREIPGMLRAATTQPLDMAAPAGEAANTGAAFQPSPFTLPPVAEAIPTTNANRVLALENLGVNPRPGQYHPDSYVNALDTKLANTGWGFASGGSDLATRASPNAQADQFNTALSNTFGENAARVTPDVIANAHARLGDVYKGVFSRNTISDPDGSITGSLTDMLTRLQSQSRSLGAPTSARIEGLINDVYDDVSKPGGLSGNTYHEWRQRGGRLDSLSDVQNPTVARYGIELRHILDNAFSTQASPEDSALLQQANDQYRALKVVEPIAEKAPGGDVLKMVPTLASRTLNEYGSFSNAGDLGTLADSGRMLVPFRSSGTSENTAANAALAQIPVVNKFVKIGAIPHATYLNYSLNNPAMRGALLGHALARGSTIPTQDSTAVLLGRILGGTGQ